MDIQFIVIVVVIAVLFVLTLFVYAAVVVGGRADDEAGRDEDERWEEFIKNMEDKNE